MLKAPLVRAVLDGRKVETRRPAHVGRVVVLDRITGRKAKRPPGLEQNIRLYGRPETWCGLAAVGIPSRPDLVMVARVQSGDRLWVRETWAPRVDLPRCGVCYRADWRAGVITDIDGPGGILGGDSVRSFITHGYIIGASDGASDARSGHWRTLSAWSGSSSWRPAILMPRWAARLVLPVEAVRFERLFRLTNDDVRAEGVDGDCADFIRLWDAMYGDTPDHSGGDPLVLVYRWSRQREVPRG